MRECEETDDLLLVTSGGQMIRTRMDQVRIVGRSSQGVTIFRTAEGEKVVSVERLPDSGGGEADAVEAIGAADALLFYDMAGYSFGEGAVQAFLAQAARDPALQHAGLVPGIEQPRQRRGHRALALPELQQHAGMATAGRNAVRYVPCSDDSNRSTSSTARGAWRMRRKARMCAR